MSNQVNEWTKVITNPFGLVGFVLFLLFGLLARVKRRDERRWLLPAAILMAGIALLGGLGLAYVHVRDSSAALLPPDPKPKPQPRPDCGQTQQSSSGPGSPNVNCVEGAVTITIDQSSGKTQAPKGQEKKQP